MERSAIWIGIRLVRLRNPSGCVSLAAMPLLVPTPPRFCLRPATVEDLDFLWRLYRDLMRPLTEDLMAWSDVSQRAVVEAGLAGGGTFVIVVDGADIGWLHVRDDPKSIFLGQLYIAPDQQGRGLGAAILRDLAARAGREAKSLTLTVMKNNIRASSLYRRLGFVVTGETKYKYEMAWCPGDPR